MTNPYWSVYKNLEKEVIEISNLIHLDDNQLSIYSMKISELLIRCAVEIESISKDLFFRVGGKTSEGKHIYFDTDCIGLLEKKWLLSKKRIIVSGINFHFQKEDNKTLTPLHKASKMGTSGSDWKRAYQAIKHNRVLNLKKGNLKNMLRALAALFILNIYFKDEIYDLKEDSQATNFPVNMGSDIFAIKLHKWNSYSGYLYDKRADFDECIYLTKWIKETEDKMKDAFQKGEKIKWNFLINHPKFKKWLKHNKIENYKGNNLYVDVLGNEIYMQMISQSTQLSIEAFKSRECEAILNKNSI